MVETQLCTIAQTVSLPIGWAYSSKQQHGLHAPIGHGHANLATQRNSHHRPHARNLSKSDGGQDSADPSQRQRLC